MDCPSPFTAPRVPNSDATESAARELRSVPEEGILRRDRTVVAAASRTGPVEAARAYASQGNDARQAAAAFDPTAAASGRAKLEGRPPARPPRLPPNNVSRGEGQSLALAVRP